MAKMALRAYTREIEELIEHGQIKEGIAHARHILSTFPKYVDAYRLLGKAYLEEQLYGDAADIFQRVLSAKPDDFISNVGMSIIREDEGNLDASIWHMERAFEVQPSNKAIQDEMRRLFGRRDGMQPPKIRLTKGALARMYAHGDLYDQAIAEIHAALADDPQRHDLQILLAKMYYKSGKQSQAIDACNQILEKLPFCLDANYIMSKIYQNSGQQEEAEYYRNTVASLDPYSAMTTKTAPLSENVAANTVTIEHLEWHPGMLEEMGTDTVLASKLGVPDGKKEEQGEEKPEWLTAAYGDGEDIGDSESPFVVGDTAGEEATQAEELPEWMMSAVGDSEQMLEESPPEAEELPDWLKGAGSGQTASEGDPAEGVMEAAPYLEQSESQMEPMAPEDENGSGESGAEEALPEFLRDAGWEQGNGEADDTLVFNEEELIGAAEEITPAEIPDWMNTMKPEGADDKAEAGESGDPTTGADAVENLDWPGDDEEQEAQPVEEVEVRDWMGGGQEQSEPDTDESAAMGWLDGGEEPEEQPANDAAGLDWLGADETPQEQPAKNDAASDWLGSDASEPREAAVEETGETPDWMAGLDQAGADEEEDEETPAWLRDLAGDEDPQPAEARADTRGAGPDTSGEPEVVAEDSEPQPVDISEGPDLDWLAAEEDPTYEPPPQKEPDADSGMDWLASLTGETPPEEAAEDPSAVGEESEAPEWMRGMVAEDEPTGETDETPAEEEQPPADSMSWLDEISREEQAAESAGETAEGQREAETPDWMGEISEEHEELSSTSAEQPAGEAQAFEDEGSGSDYVLGIDDQSMSWLEGLAAKQGAPEEELFSEPEERATEMPDWLQGMEHISDEVPPTPDAALEEMEESEISSPKSAEQAVDSGMDADVQSEMPVEGSTEKADEMAWVEEVSEDALAEEGFGVRKGGDTSQLIRSLVFDEEGKPASEQTGPVEAEEPAEASGSVDAQPEPAAPEGEWRGAANHEMVEQTPPSDFQKTPRAAKTGELDFEDVFQKGREMLESNDLENAVKTFSDLIKRGYFLDEIISELQNSIVKFPIEISLYQTMGDAYMRADRLQDALDSYSKAEELLR